MKVVLVYDLDPPFSWFSRAKINQLVTEKAESISGQFSTDGGSMIISSVKVGNDE